MVRGRNEGDPAGIGPWQKLANGIIECAVSDYRSAYKKLYRYKPRLQNCLPDILYGNIRPEKYRHIVDAGLPYDNLLPDCERFFISDWFRELTDIDPGWLVRRLEAERNDFLRGQLLKIRAEENEKQKKSVKNRQAEMWRLI